MATLAQVARRTRRGLFGLQGKDAARWNDAIARFQASRIALTQALGLIDEAAAAVTDPRDLDTLYRQREVISQHASIMDATARALESVSSVMHLSGLDNIGLFGCVNAPRLAYPAACATLNSMSATAQRLSGLGIFEPMGNFGGDIWELLHPGQVQQEYISVGKEPPSQAEIISGAASDALERAGEGAVSMIGSFKSYAVIAAFIGLGVLYYTHRNTR